MVVIAMIRIEKYYTEREIEDLIKKFVPPVTPTAGLTFYDYIIEIYDVNNIVVRSASETITLSSIDDLNNFLSTIENKKILIIAYVDITQNLILQKYNVYHIFGKYIEGILLKSKVFLYAYAIVNLITNMEESTLEFYNISESTIITKYSDVLIYFSDNITLIIENALFIDIEYVYDSFIHIDYATTVTISDFSGYCYIKALYVDIDNASLDTFYIESYHDFDLNFSYKRGIGRLVRIIKVPIPANSTIRFNINVPDGILSQPSSNVFVFVSGADNISYSVDFNNKKVIFTNNNAFNVVIDLMMEVIFS